MPTRIMIDPLMWDREAREARLTVAEQGALMRLLCEAATQHDSSVPGDDTALAFLTGMTAEAWQASHLRKALGRWFVTYEENRLQCPVIERERVRLLRAKDASAKGGRLSGESRRRAASAKAVAASYPIMARPPRSDQSEVRFPSEAYFTNCTSTGEAGLEAGFTAPGQGAAVPVDMVAVTQNDDHGAAPDSPCNQGPDAPPVETRLGAHPVGCRVTLSTSESTATCSLGTAPVPRNLPGDREWAEQPQLKPTLTAAAPALCFPPVPPLLERDFSSAQEESAHKGGTGAGERGDGGSGEGQGGPTGRPSRWLPGRCAREAEQVVDHYQTTVAPAYPATTRAFSNVATLLASGVPLADLLTAATNYAGEQEWLHKAKDMRKTCRNFYSQRDGYWRSYLRTPPLPPQVLTSQARIAQTAQTSQAARQAQVAEATERQRQEALWAQLPPERQAAFLEAVRRQHPEHEGRPALLQALALRECQRKLSLGDPNLGGRHAAHDPGQPVLSGGTHL